MHSGGMPALVKILQGAKSLSLLEKVWEEGECDLEMK
jgi:hypothetical protein